ncbi:MAG: trypsin-like peptidase domain-containing protein [Kofleriaceae bacterium]|nr:trypsin-like peptidase domain-containing protein [Kofleriaceae bacterium]
MRGSLLLLVPGLLVVAACGASSPGANAPRVKLTPKDIVQQSTDGIVRVEAGEDKIGTGFVLHASGIIATNLHVVAGSEKIQIKLHDGSTYPVTAIAGVDPGRDLALLRIQPSKPLKPLRLGDSDQMTAGDTVTAIGNPLGVFDYSVSSGLVSQVRPVCTAQEEKCPPGGLTLLQISAPISQGSSGGPLFNQFGEVIGVTTLIIAQGQSINFAVPGNYLKPLVAQPTTITMAQFAEATKAEVSEKTSDDQVRIHRQVPDHALSVLDGCSEQQVQDVVSAISSAIDIGAPLYNKGEIEACFRIYEGTSTKLERDAPCAGIGKAFGDGLLRASTMSSFKEKAWALRDTFDGLIRVAQLKGTASKTPAPAPR